LSVHHRETDQEDNMTATTTDPDRTQTSEPVRCPSSETKAYLGTWCLVCCEDVPLRTDGKFRVHARRRP
jgi:hypothetical protein